MGKIWTVIPYIIGHDGYGKIQGKPVDVDFYPSETAQQSIIEEFVSSMWSRGDRKVPTGRPDWLRFGDTSLKKRDIESETLTIYGKKYIRYRSKVTGRFVSGKGIRKQARKMLNEVS